MRKGDALLICFVFADGELRSTTARDCRRYGKLVEWATPFKIHTPTVEDFEKVHHRGSVNVHVHLPCV